MELRLIFGENQRIFRAIRALTTALPNQPGRNTLLELIRRRSPWRRNIDCGEILMADNRYNSPLNL